jgi:selenocysteine lyase/cysteine desulfurase
MDPLIDRREYAGLASCTYLNQASLGLIPRVSLDASVRFLTDVAQHGNLRLSDQAEAEILDSLRAAAADLFGAPLASIAVVGGASEGLGQLAALLSGPDGEVILVPSDFPSVTYPWLAAPGGVALLAVAEDLADRVPPLVGWKGSATPFDFRPERLSLARDARRFELSTMSYSAASGLLASITLLTGIGLSSIREHADWLAESLVQRVAPLGWAPYRPLSDRSASGHILSLRHPTAPVEEVQGTLAGEHRIITSSRVGGIRVSLHVYNDDDDVRALAEALESIGSHTRW